jgi:hypothetical protein
MLPFSLDNRLTDGGEVVSVKRRLQEDSCTHFFYRLSRRQDHSAAGRIKSIENNVLYKRVYKVNPSNGSPCLSFWASVHASHTT